MERSKAGTKEKRSLDGLNYPNPNTIWINIIWYYLQDMEKKTIKFNHQKTKWTEIFEKWQFIHVHPPQLQLSWCSATMMPRCHDAQLTWCAAVFMLSCHNAYIHDANIRHHLPVHRSTCKNSCNNAPLIIVQEIMKLILTIVKKELLICVLTIYMQQSQQHSESFSRIYIVLWMLKLFFLLNIKLPLINEFQSTTTIYMYQHVIGSESYN